MKTLILTPKARRRLKRPLGKLYPGTTAAKTLAGRKVVTVGDKATKALLDAGIRPAVAIVDYRCRRKPVGASTRGAILAFKARTIRARNPAGTITSQLQKAVAKAVKTKGGAKVLVDGEEDLAVLPAVLLAPDGYAVYYGQPGIGGVVVEVNDASRKKIKRITRMFG